MSIQSLVQTDVIVQRKVTVTLPEKLLARLDARIPSRQRSQFIAEAVENQLAIEEQLNALEESAGAWRDENHPDMLTDEDIDAWLRNLRSSWAGADHG
ncbi:MAG TPA: CopG family transcriptional regulator [Anaerolineae bacterium]|nr:CopG family transcriptional regulator [Anaerolineae bacterium]